MALTAAVSKPQARPIARLLEPKHALGSAALGLLLADDADDDADPEAELEVELNTADEAVTDADDEGGEEGVPASVAFPTRPTPNARVDPPSSAHCRPPNRWSRNRSSCQADRSSV